MPMSALKDPSLFAPPPKNVNYHSTTAEERQATRIAQKGPLTPAEYQAREKEKYDRQKEEEALEREKRRLEREEKQALRAAQQQEREGASASRLPTTNDTTGLSTTQFAPPVARSTAADGTNVIRPTAPSPANARPPVLPPRLPARQNSSPETPTSQGRGQSPTIPGGRPQLPARKGTGSSTTSSLRGPPTPSDNPQLSELQSRFARMKTSSPTSEMQPQAAPWVGSTTSSSRDYPTVSVARNLATTPNNFHGVHDEQVAKKWAPVDTSSRQYGVSTQSNFRPGEGLESPIDMRDNTVLPVKKPPPPKPKKKAELSANEVSVTPSVPYASRPK